jgi:formylmethanofuran dehydrogenase subunit B
MTDKQIIDALLKQLNGNEDSEYVTIPKEIVVAVVRMLSGQKRKTYTTIL